MGIWAREGVLPGNTTSPKLTFTLTWSPTPLSPSSCGSPTGLPPHQLSDVSTSAFAESNQRLGPLLLLRVRVNTPRIIVSQLVNLEEMNKHLNT